SGQRRCGRLPPAMLRGALLEDPHASGVLLQNGGVQVAAPWQLTWPAPRASSMAPASFLDAAARPPPTGARIGLRDDSRLAFAPPAALRGRGAGALRTVAASFLGKAELAPPGGAPPPGGYGGG
ncbi:unnamed protein product, partial [Prorocentrum cordatum]